MPGSNGAAYDAIPPVPPLARAAADIGHVNVAFDGDKVIRKIYLEEGGSGRSWLQLAALMAGMRPAGGLPKDNGFFEARPMLIPYGGAAGHISTISFVDIYEGHVPPEFLQGRYVLIGATANGLGDSYPTPTTGKTSQMAGVEIQAHLLDALLRGRAITPASMPLRIGVAVVALWLLMIAFIRLSPRANAQIAVGLLVTLAAGSYALLWFGQLWLPPAPALLGIAFVYPFWGWRRLQAVSSYMTEELRILASEQDEFPRADIAKRSSREVTLQLSLLGTAIDRLRDLRKFLSDSIRNLPDAMFVTDLEGRIVLSNAEARNLLRRLSIAPDLGVDLRPLFAKMRYTDGQEPLKPFDANAPYRGRAEVVIEELGNFDVRYVSQADANDRPVALILRIVDLSQLKQAERHREEALQLLSHDMRAPQSAILMLLDSAKDDMPVEMSSRIEKHARRTLDLAEDFVQLARAEAKPLAIEEVDLNDIVIDAADSLWPLAKARGIRIDVVPSEDMAFARGDRQLLTRALINLIGNAIKYSDDGTTITCSITTAAIGIVQITVADRGTGMTKGQLANLFARFQQGPREGVGLGLALVKLVVERHGGMIDCDSTAGVGTTFTIDLPAFVGGDVPD